MEEHFTIEWKKESEPRTTEKASVTPAPPTLEWVTSQMQMGRKEAASLNGAPKESEVAQCQRSLLNFM